MQIARCAALLGLARLRLDEADAAAAMRARASELLERVRVPSGGGWLFGAHAYLAVARVDLGLGDADRAAAAVAPIVAAAQRTGWAEPLAGGLVVLGLARTAAADHGGAEAALRRAIEVAEAAALPAPARDARAALEARI